MARPKEFDRDAALAKAVEVFWDKGYEATSTDDLVRAMGIGRQSMYDTFGDKHRLYVAALERYKDEQSATFHASLRDSRSPLSAIEAVLFGVSAERPCDRARGCLMIGATAELAGVDDDVARIAKDSTHKVEASFEHAVRAAQEKKELPAGIDARAAGRFLTSTFFGLKLSAKSGASPEALRDIARFALAGLAARP